MTGRRANPDAVSGKPMRAVQFFNLYFANFGHIVLANLLFLPFNLIAGGYIYFVYRLMDGINLATASPALIFLNIGMSGVTIICRYIYCEKEYNIIKTFIKGLKENFLRFFINGVILSIITAVSYLSIALYYNGTKTSVIFWIPLIITILITLGISFASYYMNIMTVTLDIPLKNTYRNCFLFSFGELKNNLLTTVALLILSAIVFSVLFMANNLWVIFSVIIFLQIFILPSTIQYIITFYVYDSMVDILDENKKNYDENKKNQEKIQINEQEAEEISDFISDTKDEYIFYNGRMIKRSEVEKMLNKSNK